MFDIFLEPWHGIPLLLFPSTIPPYYHQACEHVYTATVHVQMRILVQMRVLVCAESSARTHTHTHTHVLVILISFTFGSQEAYLPTMVELVNLNHAQKQQTWLE